MLRHERSAWVWAINGDAVCLSRVHDSTAIPVTHLDGAAALRPSPGRAAAAGIATPGPLRA